MLRIATAASTGLAAFLACLWAMLWTMFALSGGREIGGWLGTVLLVVLLMVSIGSSVIAVRWQVGLMRGRRWTGHALLLVATLAVPYLLRPGGFLFRLASVLAVYIGSAMPAAT